jgi:hypothetical protein
VRQLVVRIGWSIAAGLLGLFLVAWGVERTTLLEAVAERTGTEADVPGTVLLTLMAGTLFLPIGVFSALTVLSAYLRSHPSARQVPAWMLITLLGVAGGIGLVVFATHTNRISSAAEVSLDVNPGFIVGEVAIAAVIVSALVALGVRWTPRHRPARARE